MVHRMCLAVVIRRSWVGFMLVLAILLLSSFAPAAEAIQPKTIPALRNWEDSLGSYLFGANTRIVVDEDSSSQISTTASVFASDLLALTGYTIPVVIGADNVQTGDIYITLVATEPSIGQEGYVLTVGDYITVAALTDAGVFYGTRSILQVLRQGFRIQGGIAQDWPDYPERGLMLDVGRKFFSLQFLRRHIKELAYLKLNYLHLHLSDEASDGSGTYGFRLESVTHPEITSSEHYSKADMRSLIALARRYHVTIVPEIDVPSHSLAMLAPHPELALPGLPTHFDLSNPASYTLMQSLLDEFLPLFPGPFWHSGTDEYLSPLDYANYPQLLAYAQQHYGPQANAQDTYIGFVNWLDGIVKSYGKQMRAWDDIYGVTGNVNVPNSDIILEIWYPYILPTDALSKGHTIMNASFLTLYYDPGIDSLTNDPQNAINLYENWAPNLQWPDAGFVWPGDINFPALTPGIRGGKFHVWCDFPNVQTEDQIQDNIAIHLRGLAQNSWGSPKLVSDLNSFTSIVDSIGHTPGWDRDRDQDRDRHRDHDRDDDRDR
jgi:hexosaminidase